MKMKRLAIVLITFLCLGLLGNAQVDLQDGLVAYYPFNGNANDESGNTNNGIVKGTTLTTDRFGNSDKAYSFGGEGDYIEGTNISIFNSSYSVSVWVNVPSVSGVKKRIIGKGYAPDLETHNWSVSVEASGNVSFFWEDDQDVNNSIFSNTKLDEGTYYHITAVMDIGQSEYRLYINDVLEATGEITKLPVENGNNLLIGIRQDEDLSFDVPFAGQIDDIRIYNRVLSKEEIQILYSEGHAPVAEDKSVCEGSDIPGIEAAGEDLRWYGTPDLSSLLFQGPVYSTGQTAIGRHTYYVTQTVGGIESNAKEVNLTINPLPGVATTPLGPTGVCQNMEEVAYSVPLISNAVSYNWFITPSEAGVINNVSSANISIDFASDFSGSASLQVQGKNSCGNGVFSEELLIAVNSVLSQPERPMGNENVCGTVLTSNYSINEVAQVDSYVWQISPGNAGEVSGVSNVATVHWEETFSGEAYISVIAMNNCSEGNVSEILTVSVNQSEFITSLLNKIDVLEGENKGLKNDLVLEVEEKVTLESQIVVLEGERNQLKSDLVLEGEGKRTLDSQIVVLEGENKELKRDLVLGEGEISTLDSQIVVLEGEKNQLKNDLVLEGDENATLDSQVAVLEDENTQLKNNLVLEGGVKATLESQIEVLESEKDQLQDDFLLLNETITTLQTQVEILGSDYTIVGDLTINDNSTEAYAYTLANDDNQVTEQLNWILTDVNNTIINNTVANEFYITASQLSNGDYWLICRYENMVVSMQKLSVLNVTSVVKKNNKSISIYPNPGTDYVVIEGMALNSNVAIYSINGDFIKKVEGTDNQINISDLANGSYLIRIEGEQSQITKLFIKN